MFISVVEENALKGSWNDPVQSIASKLHYPRPKTYFTANRETNHFFCPLCTPRYPVISVRLNITWQRKHEINLLQHETPYFHFIFLLIIHQFQYTRNDSEFAIFRQCNSHLLHLVQNLYFWKKSDGLNSDDQSSFWANICLVTSRAATTNESRMYKMHNLWHKKQN